MLIVHLTEDCSCHLVGFEGLPVEKRHAVFGLNGLLLFTVCKRNVRIVTEISS